jgi:hypothetical protein
VYVRRAEVAVIGMLLASWWSQQGLAFAGKATRTLRRGADPGGSRERVAISADQHVRRWVRASNGEALGAGGGYRSEYRYAKASHATGLRRCRASLARR